MNQRSGMGDNMPRPFLASVAKAYASRYEDISDFCFLFPNKRSGTFFLKHLGENIGERTMLAPEVLGVGDFMAKVSAREPAERVDMVFRLYKVYCGLLGRVETLVTESDLLDFDSFAPWGEVVLGDFSEVEQYDAEAAELFRNVKDYRDIASNFLTEEQREVIERYFGYSPSVESVERFWRNVNEPQDAESKLKEKFVELWRLLPELFDGLVANLEADGLCMPGSAFRIALRRIESEGRNVLPWKKIVVVGFNMLSGCESKIFSELMKLESDDPDDSYVDFYWDATGPVLSDEKRGGMAARAMRRNISNFPQPQWADPYMAASRVSDMPESLVVAASPSNAAQVKIASLTVSEWLDKMGADKIRDARGAVVIPDENLLMPLLHSLPPELKAVNLTMGYAMRYTAVASFIYHLRRLQTHRRRRGEEYAYYHVDMRLFLAHPLVHVLIGSDVVNKINAYMAHHHKFDISISEIGRYSEVAAEMLAPIRRDADMRDTIDYIDSVLVRLDVALAERGVDNVSINSKVERAQIALYRMAMMRLLASAEQHGIRMNFLNVFHLVDRLLAGEKVTFEGEPLEGLQVMGLLETRAIDFEHLVILSMNDKVMPRRARKRTFIPDALRKGYGLPVSSQSEELYSYYFYRLLSRASDVTLVYDSRAGEGMRSGGKSRFLLQLDLLHARGATKQRNYSFRLNPSVSQAVAVEKSAAVMEKLSDYTRETDGRNLSASALSNYCQCPVKFYYRNVCGLSDDEDTPGYIDAITQGNIVHDVMQYMYLPDELHHKYLKQRPVITAELIERMLADKDRLKMLMRRAVNREYYHLGEDQLDRDLSGASAIVAERLLSQIEDVLRHDQTLAPFEIVGAELKGHVRWKVGDAPEVNISYSFDRVDYVGGRYRVIDYKTGSSHVEAADLEDIFNGEYKARYALQLMIYAHLLEARILEEEGKESGPIAMEIYDVNTISHGAVCPKVSGSEINSHRDITDDFMPRLEQMLNEIFSKDAPSEFTPTEDSGRCGYCAFKALCGRE